MKSSWVNFKIFTVIQELFELWLRRTIKLRKSHLHVPISSHLWLPVIMTSCLTKIARYAFNVFLIASSRNFTTENESVISWVTNAPFHALDWEKFVKMYRDIWGRQPGPFHRLSQKRHSPSMGAGAWARGWAQLVGGHGCSQVGSRGQFLSFAQKFWSFRAMWM